MMPRTWFTRNLWTSCATSCAVLPASGATSRSKCFHRGPVVVPGSLPITSIGSLGCISYPPPLRPSEVSTDPLGAASSGSAPAPVSSGRRRRSRSTELHRRRSSPSKPAEDDSRNTMGPDQVKIRCSSSAAWSIRHSIGWFVERSLRVDVPGSSQ